jgi:hypothetical protein
LIVGENRHDSGEYLREYDHQLGKLGLYISITNDVDLTHGCVSKENSLELINLSHFEILEIYEKMSYSASKLLINVCIF